MSSMPDPREIPELTSELIDMSREYLRQETIEPAKRLGKHAGMGLGGAAVLGLGAIFVIWGLYNALTMWLPEGEWWVVLARLITALTAAGAAGVVVWMMQRPGKAAVGDET
jgi:hypothetical protein